MMQPSKLSLGRQRKSSLGSRRSSVLPIRVRPGDFFNPVVRSEISLPKGPALKRTTSFDHLTSDRFSQRRSVSADRMSRVPAQLSQNNAERVTTNALNLMSSTPDGHYTEDEVASFYKYTLALGKARKDPRNLSDRSAQAALTEKIESYFRKDLKTSTLVQNGFNFRNITLRQYVDMMNYLLSQLWPADYPVNLQMNNYTDKIIFYMKKLGYPGKLNKSWLQTANTQGSWPQVLGTLSWLIDFIEYGRRGYGRLGKIAEAESCCESEDAIPPHIYLFNLLSQYDKWLQEDYKSMDGFVDDLKSLAEVRLNVDNHEYTLALQSVEDLKAQLDAKNLPYKKDLKENVEKKRKKIVSLQREINRATKDKEYLLQNLQASQCERTDLEKIQKRNQDIVDQLKEKLKEQSVFLEEREQVMAEKNELERALYTAECHKKFCEKELHSDLIVTNRATDKLNALCLEYNNNIVRVVNSSESEKFMIDTKSLTSDHSHVDDNLKKLMATKDLKIEESKKCLKESKARLEEATQFLAHQQNQLAEYEDYIKTLKKSEAKLHEDHKKNMNSLNKQVKKYEKMKEREKKELEELPELKEYEKLLEEKKDIIEKTAFVEERSQKVLSKKIRHLQQHLKNVMDMNLFQFNFDDDE